MVAYQGNVQFQGQGASGRPVRQADTDRRRRPADEVHRQRRHVLADLASDIHLIDLEGGHDGLTIDGKNVLAFEPTLSYDIRRVQGAGMLSNAGLFNCVFSAAASRSPRRAAGRLQVDQPTYADPQAAVCWSASLQTGFHVPTSSASAPSSADHGEDFTMLFNGQGFVVVQPSEEVPGSFVSGTGGGQQAGAGRFRCRRGARQFPRPLTHTAGMQYATGR